LGRQRKDEKMSEEQNNGPIRIALDKAKELYDEENVTVLDVVDTETFNELDYKVKGAKRINPENIKEEYEQLPEDQHVLAY
jgi:rhodanese-related sulfurtransferase